MDWSWFQKHYGAAVNRLKVRSALNPALWMVGVISVPSLGASTLLNGAAQFIVLTTAVIPVIVACFMLVWFTLTDPNKLRSESHEQVMAVMNMVEHKGGAITLAPQDVSNIDVITVKGDGVE